MNYAGFWQRAAALVIDGIVLSAVVAVIAVASGIDVLPAGLVPQMDPDQGASPMADFVVIGTGMVYYAVLEGTPLQASLGKLALGLKVTDDEGQRIDIPHAAGRYLAKVISALPLLAGFIMAAFTRRKQALHDLIFGCLVLRR